MSEDERSVSQGSDSEPRNSQTTLASIVTEIERYARLKNEIQDQRKVIKELTDDYKTLEDKIITCMKDNGVTEIRANNGNLRLQERKVASSINKDAIKKCISERIGNSEAQVVTDTLFKNRPTVSKTCLSMRVSRPQTFST